MPALGGGLSQTCKTAWARAPSCPRHRPSQLVQHLWTQGEAMSAAIHSHERGRRRGVNPPGQSSSEGRRGLHAPLAALPPQNHDWKGGIRGNSSCFHPTRKKKRTCGKMAGSVSAGCRAEGNTNRTPTSSLNFPPQPSWGRVEGNAQDTTSSLAPTSTIVPDAGWGVRAISRPALHGQAQPRAGCALFLGMCA